MKIKSEKSLKTLFEKMISDSVVAKKAQMKESLDDELKKGNVSLESIVNTINSIRAGRSLKDETVSGELQKYLNGLKPAEKAALLSFLQGISQIVTGTISGDDATEPDDSPSDVQMKKSTDDKSSIKIKPVVVSKKKGPSKEDTAAPAPIKPKEK